MITLSFILLFTSVGSQYGHWHYDDVIMTMLASQITSLTVVHSIVYSGVNQRKHQSSASLAFVREIHRGPVNFPHKWPVTRKMFPFDDVIMGGRFMKTFSHECAFRITGPLSGEFTGNRWLTLTKNQRGRSWMFYLLLAWTGCEQTVELPVIWDALNFMWRQ